MFFSSFLFDVSYDVKDHKQCQSTKIIKGVFFRASEEVCEVF